MNHEGHGIFLNKFSFLNKSQMNPDLCQIGIVTAFDSMFLGLISIVRYIKNIFFHKNSFLAKVGSQ